MLSQNPTAKPRAFCAGPISLRRCRCPRRTILSPTTRLSVATRARMLEATARSERRRSSNGNFYIRKSGALQFGAIESLEMVPPAHKRTFAASDAVSALLHPSAASGYVIEVFEQAPLQVTATDDVLGLHRSFKTLQHRLLAGGRGLYIALLPSPGGVQALELVLTRSDRLPLIEDLRAVHSDPAKWPDAGLDPDVTRHERVLRSIAEHPIVRPFVRPSRSSRQKPPLHQPAQLSTSRHA